MTGAEARRRFAEAPVAHLATADRSGIPHIVPIVFAVAADTIYSAVDEKPKTTVRLRRLRNVRANPAVALLADHYDDDWRRLWWVRADGTGRVLEPGDGEAIDAIALLTERHPQYVSQPPRGPVLAVDVHRWSGWAAADRHVAPDDHGCGSSRA